MLAQEAESGVALQDRIFPKPQRNLLRFIPGDELADVLEHVERQLTNLDVGEKIQGHRLPKYPCRHAFFNQRGACSILCLVDLGIALALEPKKTADHR